MKSLIFIILMSTAQYKEYKAELINCYSGDTCDFNIILGFDIMLVNQRVRFCDINAPEIESDQKQEAIRIKDAITHLIKKSKEIKLKILQKNKYNYKLKFNQKCKNGCWLGYIILDSANLNQLLIDNKIVDEWQEKCPK